MASPEITPAPPATGPTCGLCGETEHLVHWQRRLTPDEVAEQQAIEQARRDEAALLADPQQPPPDPGPLPDCADWTHIVHGCTHHAISIDAATLIHQAICTAPDKGDLPGCNCTPEPAPEPPAEPEPVVLPAGW